MTVITSNPGEHEDCCKRLTYARELRTIQLSAIQMWTVPLSAMWEESMKGVCKGTSSLRSLCYSLLKRGKQWLILYEISNLRIQHWIRKWSEGCVQHTGNRDTGTEKTQTSSCSLPSPSSEAVCHSCYPHSLSKSLHHGIRKLRNYGYNLLQGRSY